MNKHKRWIPHIVGGAIVTLVWAVLSGFEYWSWITCWVTFLIGSIGTNLLIDRLDHTYTKRINADKTITWEVWINDVKAGVVTDAEYAAIQQLTLHDTRIAMLQLFNIGRVAIVLLDKIVMMIPITIFWAAIAIAILEPESYTVIVHELQKADPATIIDAIRSFIHVGAQLVFATLVCMAVLGYRFGFKDYYSASIHRIIRQHCNVIAEEGKMHLTQCLDSVP